MIIFNIFSNYSNYFLNKEYIKIGLFFSMNKYLSINYRKKLTYFKIEDLEYEFSHKFNVAKINFKFLFFDCNKKMISPSDVSLYNNLHIICNMNIIKKNIIIESLPNIIKNTYFECIEFFNINEKVLFSIKIYENQSKINYSSIYLFNEKIINFNNLNKIKDYLFNKSFIIKNYNSFKDAKTNGNLKKFITKKPECNLKRNVVKKENKWYFMNIYNNYFCFCKGKYCLNKNVNQKCKYFFYLYIIDNNRFIYKKTDYLFMDFIFSELSSDDVYPIFEQMIKQNMPAHYMTENLNIYNKYCYQNKECLSIIKVNKQNYKINGDYLEKYLSLILKLKAVISNNGKKVHFASHNLFYDLEYITYISVGHGVSFFKSFLYSRGSTYGIGRNNKLLIPPSDKLISVAKKYGWKDENIIKLNLPRWSKYKKKGN